MFSVCTIKSNLTWDVSAGAPDAFDIPASFGGLYRKIEEVHTDTPTQNI